MCDVSASIYNFSEEYIMKITKIVITGGPCAGKSTGLSRIQNVFSEMGYKVLVVPETATELITGGVAPWTCGTNVEFQKCQMRLQLEKERLFVQAAQGMNAEKLLILCDRGALDNKVYMSEADFREVLDYVGTNEIELRDSYDAVFHLVSAANGAAEFYTNDNNTARTETVEQAIELDNKLIDAWTGHRHLRVIENDRDFEKKIRNLVGEICSFLGDGSELETERKFLIEYPDVEWLESCKNCRKIEIIQTYLVSDGNGDQQIRQRGMNGNYTYYHTRKVPLGDGKRIQTERRLSKDEYISYLMSADTSMRQIRKTRYCLTYENQYFEIDLYHIWSHRAILKFKLYEGNTDFAFPENIRVIKEITGDPEYKNSNIARGNVEG